MSPFTVTFDIPDWLEKGLKTGDYIRHGGEVRDRGGRVVVMLRDFVETSTQTLDHINPLLQLGSAASILNLGVSVIGFAVILVRLNEVEKNLKQELTKIGENIDLGYYAKFRTALDLTGHACTMSKAETREIMAHQAIPRFLDTQHVFLDYADKAIQQDSPIVDRYLSTLYLAYVVEARCYLEIGEVSTATNRMHKAASVLNGLVRKYIKLLLTPNPSVYLHPKLQGQVNLSRLTKVFQWLDPSFNENKVFEQQRMNLFNLEKETNEWKTDQWTRTLPSIILDRKRLQWDLSSSLQYWNSLRHEAFTGLSQAMKTMETLIETHQRFEAYQTEIKAIAQLGISFHEWLQLTPQETQPEGSNLMYIIPTEPLAL